MKGIVLAGGKGTRLFPLSLINSKHFLPIYDKPMIFYSLSILMLAQIKDILLIVNKEDLKNFKKILGNGSQLGIKISYKVQKKPIGIPDAFIVGENFIKNDSVCLILGDNFFYGQDFTRKLIQVKKNNLGATNFCYKVKDPNKFGIIEFDKKNNPKKIVEKPSKPKSDFASTGLYFFDNKVLEYSKKLKLSKRGEYEIADIINIYLKEKKLNIIELGRGYVWRDMGEFDSLLDTSQFVRTIQELQGIRIASLEEISYNNKWLKKLDLIKIINKNPSSSNSNYLKNLIK